MDENRTAEEEKFEEYRKSHKTKVKRMIVFILISHTSRYLHFKDLEQFPSEKSFREMVGTHPHSTEVPTIHHLMKFSLQTLA
jgi:hypothetical protein